MVILEGMNRNANGNKSKICQLILNNNYDIIIPILNFFRFYIILFLIYLYKAKLIFLF